MATEVEYVNYKDFVADLESTEAPGVDDVTVVSNKTDGPRSIPANTSALTNTATDSDLTDAASFELQTAAGKKKAPANLLAKQSTLETTNGNVTALATRASDIERNVDCLDAGYYLTFEQGTIASATGADSSESHRVRTVGYQKVETFEKFYAPLNWVVTFFAYTSESTDGYLGNATLIFGGSGDRTKYKDAVLTAYPTSKFVRFVVRDKDDATITPSSVTDAGIYCKCDYSVSDTDKLAKKNESDIAQINSELDMMNTAYGFTLEQGTIGGAAGTDSSSNSAVRSVGYFDVDQMDKVYAPVGYQVIAFAYSSSDATGYLGNRRIIHGTQGSRYAGKDLILSQYPTAKFARFVIKTSDESTVTPSDVITAGVYGVFWISVGAIEGSVRTDAEEYIYDKDLTLTADKVYTVSPGKHRKKNAIITIDSMYTQGENVTDVPYIQLQRSSKGADNGMHAYYTCKYFCGKNGTYTRQMFRVPPYGVTSGNLSITLVVPEGVTLNVREISISYDDVINRDDCGIILCAHGYCGEGAPANTLAAFEAAAKLGYRYCITIPKVTSDGVYVCLHDDDSIQATARNDDGSQIAQEYRDRPVSDFTYQELLQFDFGIMRGLNYKDERIPLLEDFFALCARTGMHPMLSVHPNLSGHWDNIKALAVKYNLLNKLNIKSDYSSLAIPMATLGDDIESYTIDELSSSTDRVTAFDALKRNHNITKARCVIEYGKSVITDALISNALSNGYQVGWVNVDGVDLRPYIAKGVTIFTEDRNSSVGLPW